MHFLPGPHQAPSIGALMTQVSGNSAHYSMQKWLLRRAPAKLTKRRPSTYSDCDLGHFALLVLHLVLSVDAEGSLQIFGRTDATCTIVQRMREYCFRLTFDYQDIGMNRVMRSDATWLFCCRFITKSTT